MSWKCENCGQALKGTETYCPNCAAKAVYRCVNCGKELDNGKNKHCALCRTALREKRIDALKKVGGGLAGAVATVGSIAVGVLTKGKIRKS